MTEYPELFEKIDLLDKEMDVQAAILEKLVDQVSYLEEAVLQLERTRVVRRSSVKKEGVGQTQTDPSPSEPGGYSEDHTSESVGS